MHNLTIKKKLAILISAGLILLTLGCMFNFQKGLILNNHFWRIREDGSYTRGKDSVLCTPGSEGTHFDIVLDGEAFSADMAKKDENLYFEFSNGWAVELAHRNEFLMEIGDIWLTGNYSITPLDFEAMGCRFEKALPETSTPFYDENGQKAGDYHTLAAESGEIIEVWETWDDPAEQAKITAYGTVRREVREIREGEPLVSYEHFDVLFVNESGEYLMNPEVFFNIGDGWSDDSLYRLHLARFLQEISDRNAGQRGSFTCIFMFLLFYCLGGVQFVWPEETAFFGSRWRYRNEPELSDEGLMSVQFSAVVLMIISAFMLFIPAFA
ncbi:MAG: hypothetical protein IKM02_03585 [Clostridia bacterium]|nr:hypothetical protein [Clostridia bacterium]